MMKKHLLLSLLCFLLTFSVSALAAPLCRASCANLTIRFPFGIDSGCGIPHFRLFCTNNATQLQIVFNAKPFAVRHIDYDNSTLVLTDPSMSDCRNLNFDSAGFNLDLSSTGLTLAGSTVLLLNCLAFSQELNLLNSQYDCHNPTCLAFMSNCHTDDLLTSCCRVTDPGNEIDLYPMQCTSYTSIYAPDNPIFAPSTWSYGIELQWSLPSEVAAVCERCQARKGLCGYNAADTHQPFMCLCDYGDSHSSRRCEGCIAGLCAPSRIRRMIVGLSIGSGLLVFTGLLMLLLRSRHKRFKTVQDDSMDSQDYLTRNPSVELAQVLATMTGPLPLTLFSYKELAHATASFSDARLLGDGGYAMVYKAKFCDGRELAVKRLNHQNHRRLEHFYNEVRILSQLRHPNLVQLVGFCLQGRDLLLVYEYISNGTLEHHLQTTGTGLLWETRLNVASEVAEALSYLHFSVNPPIFHRDVKSSNILMSDKLQAKVADFGLSRLVPISATHVSTAPQGTPGYVDPEYHQCYRLTDKSDVYSFGVVLMELISGKRAIDLSRPGNEVNLSAFATARILNGSTEELLDPRLVRQSQHTPLIKETIKQVLELAFKCIALERRDRPNMKDVTTELQRIRLIGGYHDQ